MEPTSIMDPTTAEIEKERKSSGFSAFRYRPIHFPLFRRLPSLSHRSGSVSRKVVLQYILLLLLVIVTKLHMNQEHHQMNLKLGTNNREDHRSTGYNFLVPFSSSSGQEEILIHTDVLTGPKVGDLISVSSHQKDQIKRRHQWRRKFPHRPSLHLVGERHSGTKWMSNHLIDCFGDQVDFVKGYSTFKHWFQVDDDPVDETSSNTSSSESWAINRAVVISQFRNVWDWTEAMRSKPYSSPSHFNLSWSTFVTKPWTMPRYGEDKPFDDLSFAKQSNITCRNKCSSYKRPYEIIPCLANNTFFIHGKGRKSHFMLAFYEMDPRTGLPFPNILALRKAKILNFLSMQHFSQVSSFHVVRFEDLVHDGSSTLIRELEQELNATARCQPLVGGDSSRIAARPLHSTFVEYMDKHVDWETEALLGYSKNNHPQEMLHES